MNFRLSVYPFPIVTMTIQTLGTAILTLLKRCRLLLWGSRRRPTRSGPANAQFVVGINVVASRSSDFGQYLSTRFNGDMKGLEQFTAETGFDPRRDLESVIVAGILSTTGKQNTEAVVLARGTFDQSKIRSAALAKGAAVQTFSGVDLYVTGAGNHKNAFAFLESNVFATGSMNELQQAVATRSTPVNLNPQLQQLISQAGTDNDIWFASTVPASRFATHLEPEMDQSLGGSQTLQAISAASGGVKFGSSLEITLDAMARSDKDASALADVFRFGASLLQMKGQSDPHSALLASALNQMLVIRKRPECPSFFIDAGNHAGAIGRDAPAAPPDGALSRTKTAGLFLAVQHPQNRRADTPNN